jgi:Flp pilus assembly protein CpaB
MRRGRVFLYLSLILILLVAGGYLLYTNFLKPPTGPTDATAEVTIPDRVDIVVITQKAPRGTVLDETVLGLIPLPRDLVISGMFTDLAQVVGRQAKFDLDSGIPLTVNMLVDSAAQLSDAGSVASLSIPEGMVAKSIPINRLASVSYALRPGDRVVVIASMQFIDMDSEFQTKLPNDTAVLVGGTLGLGGEGEGPTGIAGYAVMTETDKIAVAGRVDTLEGGEGLGEDVYMIPSENQRPRLAAQIIIPSATVLHVGDFSFEEEAMPLADVEVPAAPPAEGEAAPVPEESPPDNITLIVSPQEAVNLTYLIDSGVKISLALRSAGDSTVIDTETATMQYFLEDYTIPLPGKLPYGFAPRVDEVENADEVIAEPTP